MPPTQPRLLFVTDVAPAPTTRGNQTRTAGMIEAYLELGYAIDIILLNRESDKEELEARLKSKFPKVEVTIVQHPRLQRIQLAGIIRFFTKWLDKIGSRKWRLQNIESAPRQFDRAFRRAIEKVRYNVVHVNYLRLTPYALRRFEGQKVVDLHDVISIRFGRKIQNMSERKWLQAQSIHEADELRLLSEYDRAVCITEDDREYFVAHGIEPDTLAVIPAFFKNASLAAAQPQKYDLLFLASDGNFNTEALIWFIREIFPLARERLPGLSLAVAGRVGSAASVKEAIDGCAGRDDIHVLGFCDDLASLYAQSSLVIAPMLFGTGMNIKVAEALSFGKAVVGTRCAFRGIAVTDRCNAVIAEQPSAFADAICELLGDSQLRSSISSEAKKLFLRDHSVSAATAKLRAIVSAAV